MKKMFYPFFAIMSVILMFLFAIFLFSGSIISKLSDLKELATGLEGTIQSYDEESQLIDQIKGKSISFTANKEFVKDNGSNKAAGTVLEANIGGKQLIHVGSTLLFYEKGMENIFDEYAKKVDIENTNRSIPVLNHMANSFKSKFTGNDKVILIRSQSGKPLATFAGDKVTVKNMAVGKMSKITIDGKRLYIYRADYSIYDTSLLMK